MILNNYYKLLYCANVRWGYSHVTTTSGNPPTANYVPDYMALSLTSWARSTSDYGVLFGTGTTPPSADDYWLSGSVISSGLSISMAKTSEVVGEYVTHTYTLVNTTAEDITIGEIGATIAPYNNGYNYFLVERTALDTPLVIPGGGVGQITYTINFAMPDASA